MKIKILRGPGALFGLLLFSVALRFLYLEFKVYSIHDTPQQIEEFLAHGAK